MSSLDPKGGNDGCGPQHCSAGPAVAHWALRLPCVAGPHRPPSILGKPGGIDRRDSRAKLGKTVAEGHAVHQLGDSEFCFIEGGVGEASAPFVVGETCWRRGRCTRPQRIARSAGTARQRSSCPCPDGKPCCAPAGGAHVKMHHDFVFPDLFSRCSFLFPSKSVPGHEKEQNKQGEQR